MAFQASAAEDVATREDNGVSVRLRADGAVICEAGCDNGDDTCGEVLAWCQVPRWI